MTDPFRPDPATLPLTARTVDLLRTGLDRVASPDAGLLVTLGEVAVARSAPPLRGDVETRARDLDDVAAKAAIWAALGIAEARAGDEEGAAARLAFLEGAARGPHAPVLAAGAIRVGAALGRAREVAPLLDPADSEAWDPARLALAEARRDREALEALSARHPLEAARAMARIGAETGDATWIGAARALAPTDAEVAGHAASLHALLEETAPGWEALAPHLFAPWASGVAAAVEALARVATPSPEAAASAEARALVGAVLAEEDGDAEPWLAGAREAVARAVAGAPLEAPLALALLRAAFARPGDAATNRAAREAVELAVLAERARGSAAGEAALLAAAAACDPELGDRLHGAAEASDRARDALVMALSPADLLDLVQYEVPAPPDDPARLAERVAAVQAEGLLAWRPWVWRAALALHAGDASTAVTAGRRAVACIAWSKAPPALPHLFLARALLLAGEPDLAAGVVVRCFEGGPRSPSGGYATSRLAGPLAVLALRTLRECGDPAAALHLVQAGGFAARPSALSLERARCLSALGRDSEALEAVERGLEQLQRNNAIPWPGVHEALSALEDHLWPDTY